MRKRKPRKVPIHDPGLGSNLDVMTLSGYGQRRKGLWQEVYGGKKKYPKLNGTKKKKCVSWKTVGKGCDCKPVCASFTSRGKGTSKKKAVSQCERKCKTKKRNKRGRS